ncbi:hypothetical protein D3C73_1394180 [compost metagenome]
MLCQGAAVIQLVRPAHAGQIHRDAAGIRLQIRDNITVHVAPGRVAVQEKYRDTLPFLHIMQLQPVDLEIAGLERETGHKRQCLLIIHNGHNSLFA